MNIQLNKLLIILMGCISLSANAIEIPATNDLDLSSLMAQCAPTVHPDTMKAVMSAESRGHKFAIADAGPVKLPWAKRKSMVRSLYPTSLDEAESIVNELLKKGHTVSLGLGQVNDRNLSKMGISVRDAFDPCMNLAVSGKILTEFYQRAVVRFGAGPQALKAALSAYNSGSWVRGAQDGYVDLVIKQHGRNLTLTSNKPISNSSYRQKSRKHRIYSPDSGMENIKQFSMTSVSFEEVLKNE